MRVVESITRLYRLMRENSKHSNGKSEQIYSWDHRFPFAVDQSNFARTRGRFGGASVKLISINIEMNLTRLRAVFISTAIEMRK